MLGKGFAFLIGVASLLLITSVNYALVLGAVSIASLLINNWNTRFKKLTRSFNFNFIILGLIWSCINIVFWAHYSSNWIKEPTKTTVEGVICSIPVHAGERLQFDFCVERVNNQNVGRFEDSRFRFTWGKFVPPSKVQVSAGQYWQFKAKLKPPHGRYNPAGFDYQKWMLAQGYAGSGQVINSQLLFRSSIQSQFHQFRQLVFNKLVNSLSDSAFQGMLLALAMGEKAGIEQTQWEVLRQSGTSHLLAISGLHVGVAALWCYWLALFVWKKSEALCLLVPAQKIAQVVSLIGALSILLLSGMGLPAQRAFIMLAVFVVSRWSGRHYSLLSVLGIAVVAILLWHPFAVLSASFWLSFFAVLIIGLSLQRQPMFAVQNYRSKVLNWLKINAYLYIAMLPISIIFFDMFSLVAIVANLILIPIASFLLIPVLYGGMLLMSVNDDLASLLFSLSSKIIELMYWFQYQLAQVNLESLGTAENSQFVLLLSLVLCLLLLPNKLFSKFIYIPILAISLLIVYNPQKSDHLESEIAHLTAFDIGQGLSIFIETPDGNVLYDTGWGNKDYNLAQSVIAPYLDSHGIKTIDKLVISHGDSDHAGGLDFILDNYEVKQLISGELLRNRNSIDCHSYSSWGLKGITFKFLPHLPFESRTGNNTSCVLSIKTNLLSILLTGDIEKAAEQALINNEIQQHDILIAPHHGSKTSSTQAFVNKVLPKQVIFSTGYNNQWQFPKIEVVDRYKAIASDIWITHEVGAVQVKLNIEEGSSSIFSEKQNNPHFWH